MGNVDPQLPSLPNPNDWSIHHNNHDLVFPPIHHENLQILSPHSDHHTPKSPPSSSPFHSRIRGWTSIALQMLRSKLSSFRNRGPIWSIGVPAAALLMFCWIIVAIRKKRTLTPNEARLITIVNKKERKIAQLLNQIAQMNEILINRHKALAAKVE
ncbi:hypothetical protein PHAVU_003G188100 [Phaseolus vulgaris]|uniref:Transmembrane protein n=1 Tax=Phaseolus vulgaris TaxID=3885 RepID=V7CAW6_PHAVU|nr:hypothetical protein PHAVU_003G188100g [Phaseolus vulgaris]XP_007155287.1 hypothetical protein PHAVU_003G188100g [Phaseolus vulgaris]ESW27279.1 hypothetical protein PHAVU_003G188100g [Phaseolus vulgaris]ESW27281.1 hypothetical protein PHAVU_003G188100g [Phaseolus vulgaris]